MPNNSVKDQVLDLLRDAQAAELSFIGELSDSERNAIGTAEKWEAKDIVAHIIFWLECASVRLAAVARGETPPSFNDYERLNAENFEARRNRSWPDVIGDLNRSTEKLLSQVQGFSDTELLDPKHYDWLNGRRLWQSIAGTVYAHPYAHIADYRMRRGNSKRAIELQEAATRKMDQIEGADGEPAYNLACFYALAGERDKALSLLPEALRRSPTLVEWSKEDPDLVSLRGEPAYQALYAVSAE